MDGILTGTSTEAAARAWIADFAAAVEAADARRLAALFAAECHWRDILAFTWDLRTASGGVAIARRMAAALAGMAPRGFTLAAGRTPPPKSRDVLRLEEQLADLLAVPVEIRIRKRTKRGDQGELAISFGSLDDLGALLDRLGITER